MNIKQEGTKMNEREKAFECMENIENEENYLLSHLRIHKELAEYDQAIEYGDMTLELNPENKNALYLMTEIYDILDDEERALFYFGELATSIASNGTSPFSFFSLLSNFIDDM